MQIPPKPEGPKTRSICSNCEGLWPCRGCTITGWMFAIGLPLVFVMFGLAWFTYQLREHGMTWGSFFHA